MSWTLGPRGVPRGRCLCNRCDFYEKKDGLFATCGYCGCPPSEHIVVEVDDAHGLENLKSSTSLCSMNSTKSSSNNSSNITEAALCTTSSCKASSSEEPLSKISSSKTSFSEASSSRASVSKVSTSQAPLQNLKSTSQSKSSEVSKKLTNLPARSIDEITSMEKYVPNKFEKSVVTALEKGKLERNHKCSMIRDIGRAMSRNKETNVRKIVSVSLIAAKKYPLLGNSPSIEKRLHTYFKNQSRNKHSKSENKNESTNNSESTNISGIDYVDSMEKEMGAGTINKNKLKYLLNQTRRDRNEDAINLNAQELRQKYRALLNEELDQATLEELVPKKNEALILTGIGSNPKDLMCYVDSYSIFAGKPKEAVLRLMAAYWIFKVAFEKEFRQQLVLISVSIFGTRSKDVLTSSDLNLINVLNIIEKANINF